MKYQTIQRYTNVKADNAEEFAAKLDEALRSLKISEQPHIDRNVPFLAHIFYLENVSLPENIKDEYEQKGEMYFCSDCPCFTKPKDGRIKNVKCKYKEILVREGKSACVTFYQRLNDGTLDDWNE